MFVITIVILEIYRNIVKHLMSSQYLRKKVGMMKYIRNH